jgi:hypothetical protein
LEISSQKKSSGKNQLYFIFLIINKQSYNYNSHERDIFIIKNIKKKNLWVDIIKEKEMERARKGHYPPNSPEIC